MLSGAVLFGAVVWFQQRNSVALPSVQDSAGLVRLAQVLWGIAIMIILLVWFKKRDVPSERKSAYRIIAYAASEGLALLGGVIWLVTGSPAWYGPGMVFMVVVFVLFSPRND